MNRYSNVENLLNIQYLGIVLRYKCGICKIQLQSGMQIAVFCRLETWKNKICQDKSSAYTLYRSIHI